MLFKDEESISQPQNNHRSQGLKRAQDTILSRSIAQQQFFHPLVMGHYSLQRFGDLLVLAVTYKMSIVHIFYLS